MSCLNRLFLLMQFLLRTFVPYRFPPHTQKIKGEEIILGMRQEIPNKESLLTLVHAAKLSQTHHFPFPPQISPSFFPILTPIFPHYSQSLFSHPSLARLTSVTSYQDSTGCSGGFHAACVAALPLDEMVSWLMGGPRVASSMMVTVRVILHQNFSGILYSVL